MEFFAKNNAVDPDFWLQIAFEPSSCFKQLVSTKFNLKKCEKFTKRIKNIKIIIQPDKHNKEKYINNNIYNSGRSKKLQVRQRVPLMKLDLRNVWKSINKYNKYLKLLHELFGIGSHKSESTSLEKKNALFW